MNYFFRLNSACFVEREAYKTTEYDSDLESEYNVDFEAAGDFSELNSKLFNGTSVKKFVIQRSPEEIQKRKKAHDNWLQNLRSTLTVFLKVLFKNSLKYFPGFAKKIKNTSISTKNSKRTKKKKPPETSFSKNHKSK